MNRVVYQYYTLRMRKRKGGNLQISSTMVFFPLYFIMDSGYTNEVSVYKLYLLGVNLSVIGRVLGQAFLRTTSPSRLRRATSPGRGGFGSPRKVNGFARGSPTRGAVERSETERLYEDRAFPLQESPARRIASSIFLPKFMVYLFCGLARPLTPDQQDGMGGKTCCCCRRTCFFKLYADKPEKRRFTQNVQPQKNCGLLWHYR